MLCQISRLAVSLLLIGANATLFGCSNDSAPDSIQPLATGATSEAASVVVVENLESVDSGKIAAYYMGKRKIPSSNLIRIRVSTADTIAPSAYRLQIENPVRQAIAKLKVRVDYIVLTKGIPIRLLDEGGYSVDATLGGMNLKQTGLKQKVGAFGLDEVDEEAAILRAINPYFRKKKPFSSKEFGMYLVTRLTGYSIADAMRLVDLSVKATASKAPILLDSQPEFAPGSGYAEMEETLMRAASLLDANGANVQYDETAAFVQGKGPLLGYASWGSNDPKFDAEVYKKIRFVPGALAETFVSTSGRTFSSTKGGQSLIADLIAQGVTGVKGYVSEPYTFALCKVEILFDRYLAGYNLAESFYAATPLIKWKDIVIGDPLCRPFAKK